MNEPPVPSMFKQLLEHAGVVVSKEPLVTTSPSIQQSHLTSWEGVIENLVSSK